MADRDSQSGELELITDPDEKAQVEAENALRQTRVALDMLPDWIRQDRPQLRPSLFQRLHGILMKRISRYPGVFRPGPMKISNSKHTPPPGEEVPRLVEELCDYVNQNWSIKSALHLSAYVLWRTNWIHPFADGNGRTARIVSYLILCAHTRSELPGSLTIPEQISAGKRPYYAALEDADKVFRSGIVDVSSLESLLEGCLAAQLVDFVRSAGGRIDEFDLDIQAEIDDALSAAQAEGILDREARPVLPSIRNRKNLLDSFEGRPVLYGGLIALAIAIAGWIFFK